MFSNGHPPDDLLDVDAAVAQRGAFLVRLGDLGLERDDAFESVVYLGHALATPLLDGRPIGRACRRHSAPLSGSSHLPPVAAPRVGSMASRGTEPDGSTFASLRAEYARAGLTEADLAPDPFAMFDRWLREAVAAGLYEPNAMVVATVGADGQPSVADGAAQGLRRAGLRLLHQHRLAQGRRSWPATRAARCCSPGTRSSARCGSTGSRRRWTGRRGGVLRAAARAARSSAPGRRTSPGW